MIAAASPNKRPSLPDRGLKAAEIHERLREACANDYRYADGRVFNSISSTPLPIAARVYSRYLGTNLGDNRIFPSLHRMEALVIELLGGLLGLPASVGTAVSGATEANLLATLVTRKRAEERRGAAHRLRILLPDNAHFSFDKIATLLNAELIRVKLDERLGVDLQDFAAKLDSDITMAVVTAGTSEAGAVDNVPAAAALAVRAGVPLHVDAATGGLLIPWARELGEPLPACDFSVPGVCSMSIDPHKYGGAPIPAGYLLCREPDDLARLHFGSHYKGTRAHHTLLGTRPGAAVLAAYAALCSLGCQGFRRQAAKLLGLRSRLLKRLQAAGLASAFAPQLTVVGVSVPEPERLLRRLEARGYLVSLSERHRFLRLVLHNHHSGRHIDMLVDAMAEMQHGGRRS